MMSCGYVTVVDGWMEEVRLVALDRLREAIRAGRSNSKTTASDLQSS